MEIGYNRRMEYEAFIFDMDGTLVDNMDVHTEVWLRMLREQGVEIDAETLRPRMSGKTNARILREFIGDHLSPQHVAALVERKEAIYRTLYAPHLEPVAGLLPFLEASQRLGVPMAVATSAGMDNVHFVLDGLALRDFFRVVVSDEDVERGKPDPEIFLLAAERLGIPPHRCLVFEDSPSGIEAAGRAGMGVVALATTAAPQEFAFLEPVVRVARDFTELEPRALLRK